MKTITLATIFILFSGYASGQNKSLLLDDDFITDARQAIDSVYNLNYKGSLEILRPWQEEFPDNPVWVFWPVLEIWWKILPDIENTQYDSLFFAILDDAKKVSAERLRNNRDIDALIIKSMSYGFSARHLSNRSSWYQSIRQARNGMNYFRELERLVPDLVDIQFGMGMTSYFMAYFTEQYPIIRPFAWMLPKGDREDGLMRIRLAANESTFMIPEATFFLGHIHLHYERNFTEALRHIRNLISNYPNNGFYHRLLVRAFYRNGSLSTALIQSRQTLDLWQDKNDMADQSLKEELYLIRGRIFHERGDKKQALEEFYASYVAGSQLRPSGERKNFLTSSYYIGHIYLAWGNYDTARQFLELVATSNLDFVYVDRAKTLLTQEF